MLLLSRVLNTALVGVLVLLGMIWFYPPANATIVIRGEFESSSTGGFSRESGEAQQKMFHPFYDPAPTIPSSEWIWSEVVTPDRRR